MAVSEKEDLLSLSDHVFQRTQQRLEGLADDEYLWEPAPSCWSVRPRPGGAHHRVDGFVLAEPGFTTIAWRLSHLIECYGGDRNAVMLDVAPAPAVIGPTGDAPATAAEALDLLDRAHARWRAHLEGVDADRLRLPLGERAGPYADASVAGYVFHMVDEFVHHGAEIALLRDLYRVTRREPVALHTVDAYLEPLTPTTTGRT